MLNFITKYKKEFISGREIITKGKIEKYELMDLVRKGLQPWHPVNLQPIREEIDNKIIYIRCNQSGSPIMGQPIFPMRKSLPHSFNDVIEELYPFLEECLFKTADIVNLFPGNSAPKKMLLSQIHKDAVRDIAKKMWGKEATLTIEDVINSNEINSETAPNSYNEKTLRGWVKDLAPNRNPGRRPHKS